jgi:hypothetical protein
MRARARLTRLERAARSRRLDDPCAAMSDDELAEAIGLTRKWLAAPSSLTPEEGERFAAVARRFAVHDGLAAS